MTGNGFHGERALAYGIDIRSRGEERVGRPRPDVDERSNAGGLQELREGPSMIAVQRVLPGPSENDGGGLAILVRTPLTRFADVGENGTVPDGRRGTGAEPLNGVDSVAASAGCNVSETPSNVRLHG
jgi:hypothetical protein